MLEAAKPYSMTREEIKQKYADIKAKLKAAQTLLDSLNDVDEDDLQSQADALKEVVRLHQEAADIMAEIDRLQGNSSRKK
jgi:hypothetical protein